MRRRPALAACLLALGLSACSSNGAPGVATSSARLPLTGPTSGAAGTPLPTQPPPAAVVITVLSSPVQRGTRATVSAVAPPRARCRAAVAYPGTSTPTTALGLHTATARGDVSWAWTVAARTPPGQWPLSITCSPGGTARTILTVR